MATNVSNQATYQPKPDRDRGMLTKVVAVMLGIAVPLLLVLALWAAVSAQKARDDAQQASSAAPAATASMPGMTHDAGASAPATPSYAGIAPANADALAAAHAP